MALLLLLIDMQRQFSESPLQLMEPKEPRWACMAITQLNTVLNFLRNSVISRSAGSSANYHTHSMQICSWFLLQYNYRLSIKCRGFSTVWNGIFSQQICQRNAEIHWNLNIEWGNMFSLRIYMFSTWYSVIHILVSPFVCLIQTHIMLMRCWEKRENSLVWDWWLEHYSEKTDGPGQTSVILHWTQYHWVHWKVSLSKISHLL